MESYRKGRARADGAPAPVALTLETEKLKDYTR